MLIVSDRREENAIFQVERVRRRRRRRRVISYEKRMDKDVTA
jgi:hypothetical protein